MLKLITPSIETLDTIVQIERIAPDLRAFQLSSPFMSPTWLTAWLRSHSPEGCAPRILVARQDEKIIGFFPLMIVRQRGDAILQFMGSGSTCPDYMSLATDAEHSEAVMQAFASEILSWDDWDTLKLDGVATGDENVRRLAELMQDADCSVSERTAFNCWRLELPGSLDEYLQSVSKNHRKKARRKLKKIESGEFAFKEAIDPASLAQGLSILEDLHQRRRKSLGEPGCFSDPRFRSLLEGVSTQALEKGTLRLFWFEHEGHPVAADFALVEGATVFAYQSGIAPEHLELEPGNVNNLWHIVRAIEEGQSAIDFLRGDEPYKAQIGASPMPHVNFRISSPSLLPKIKHQVLDVGLRIRDFVTPLIPATKS